MELLTYKSFPKPIRLVISNTWVRELMFQLDACSHSALLDKMTKTRGRETRAKQEEKSNFFYLAMKKRPVSWVSKINDIESHYPNTKSILNNNFWHFIFNLDAKHYRPKPNHIYNHYRGPTIKSDALLALVSEYVESNDTSKLNATELEQIHSIDGLSAFLSIHYLNLYEKRPTGDYLTNLFETFFRTFAIRYRSDFVWSIFNFLKAHIKEYGSSNLPQFVLEIESEDILIFKLEQLNEYAEKATSADQTLREKLILLARDKISFSQG